MNTGGVLDSHTTEWNRDTELPGGLSGGYTVLYLKARMGDLLPGNEMLTIFYLLNFVKDRIW